MFSLLHHSLFAKTSPQLSKAEMRNCAINTRSGLFLQKLFCYREVILGFGGKFAVKNGENVYKRHLTIFILQVEAFVDPPSPTQEDQRLLP